MFNITVINLRKTVKKIIFIVLAILIIFIILKCSKNFFSKCFKIINSKCEEIASTEISYSNYEKIKLENGLKKILSSELVSVEEISDEKIENDNIVEIAEIEENNIESTPIEEKVALDSEVVQVSNQNLDYSNLKTEVVDTNNLKETYNAEYNGVKIKNESSYTLTKEMLTPNIEYINKKDILIFHTHTCESYTQTSSNSYQETGNFRTTNLNYTVAKVGDELSNALISKNYNVIHDTTYHDYPSYTGSYNRSLVTVRNILNKNPQIQTVIDLHRDAIGSKSDYGPTVKIGDEKVAQLMFVMGTNGGGLDHPEWTKNLKYAIKIQQKANEMFPGLFRPIIVRNSRYNQHLATNACIIEVGATGNTLEECTASMKYLAEVISEVIK